MEIIEKNKLCVLGNNQDGCLLTGDKNDVLKFKFVDNLIETNYSFKISTGMTTCCLYYKNFAFLWGKLSEEKDNCVTYTKFQFEKDIANVKIGDLHALFLIDGNAFSYGHGKRGELGMGDEVILNLNSPSLINTYTKIKKVYAGVRTSFLINGINLVYLRK
jgi:hypothetical protein